MNYAGSHDSNTTTKKPPTTLSVFIYFRMMELEVLNSTLFWVLASKDMSSLQHYWFSLINAVWFPDF